MEKLTVSDLKKLYLPPKNSHKGENGKLTIIGGSKLFHGASLWALKVASRIVDMVFYSSIPENNTLTKKLKSQIFDFIAVPREEVENYIEESDCVLIGPGMTRAARPPIGVSLAASPKSATPEVSLGRILSLKDEGEQTFFLTKYLLRKFPNKKWVIDAGSLQMMEPEWLNENCLITPHKKEFLKLFPNLSTRGVFNALNLFPILQSIVNKYKCTVLLKGMVDVICGPGGCKISEGGNQGMTKGGTGDVLAGLAAALACKNDLFLAACAASFINKRAGEELAKKVGYFFNASDLADEIPQTMKKLLLNG